MKSELAPGKSPASRYRLLLLALALALITGLVAGCGPGNSSTTPKSSQSTEVGY